MIRALDIKEERQVLELLKDAEFLDNGASRCVFNCSDEIGVFLGIESDNYIIKLACGLGGVRQTQAEVKCFIDHPYAPLAEIIAYGRYIEVMEKVDCDDFRDFADACCEDENVPYDDFYDYNGDDDELAEEAYDVIIQLHRIFGHTSDNGQLGRDRHDNLVAYDYGFDTGLSCCDQTSDVADYVYDDIQRNAYIDAVIDLLDKSIEMLEAWEDNFTAAETEIYDHDNSQAWYKYRVIGYTEDGRDFYHNYRNLDIAKQVANQLSTYIIFEIKVRLDKSDWEQQRMYKEIYTQQGDADSIQQLLENEDE